MAPQGTTLDRRETANLIGSDKVQGTPVYRSNGERVGTIDRVMIDKLSGKVAYAVMSFGGFMGIGEDYYPLPWSLLTYNESGSTATRSMSASSSSRARRNTRRHLGLVRPRARPQGLRLLRRDLRSGAREARPVRRPSNGIRGAFFCARDRIHRSTRCKLRDQRLCAGGEGFWNIGKVSRLATTNTPTPRVGASTT